mgnify:CR=1 FL=1
MFLLPNIFASRLRHALCFLKQYLEGVLCHQKQIYTRLSSVCRVQFRYSRPLTEFREKILIFEVGVTIIFGNFRILYRIPGNFFAVQEYLRYIIKLKTIPYSRRMNENQRTHQSRKNICIYENNIKVRSAARHNSRSNGSHWTSQTWLDVVKNMTSHYKKQLNCDK